ncbi:DUF771 domain-containing protein [Staphylococcus saprophyticus]|nr:DUF771 domain-containing protein [Staphylococcus saprophyticus]
MTQTIQVTVPVPETHVLIPKVEYQDLIDNQPINMTLAEVAATYPTTKQWIVENIINDDYFRRKIAPFSQFVNPDGKGKYLFNRKKMRKFLQDYDEEIKARANRNF